MAKKILTPRENDKILSHSDKIKFLENLISSKKIPHAFLFTGPKGIGKATMAFYFATAILSIVKNENKSQNNVELDLFGMPVEKKEISNSLINKEISERVKNNTILDLCYLQKEEDKKYISIDNIRDIHKFLNLSPADNLYRVAIIDAADDLNLNSANGLLKILEEPNKNIILILINHGSNTLLPTIKSRCVELKFNKLNKEEFSKILNDLGYDKNIDDLYEVSNGSIGNAIDIIEKNTINLVEKFNKALQQKVIKLADISAISKEIKAEENWESFKNIFLNNYSHKIRNNPSKENLDKFYNVSKLLYNSSTQNMDIQDTLKILSNQINT